MSAPVHRYLVFHSPAYYPYGGWGDFKSSHDQLNDAIIAARMECENYRSTAEAQVVDLHRGEAIVEIARDVNGRITEKIL